MELCDDQVEFFMQSLLLQCKVYNRIKKFEDAISKGTKCLDLAQNHDNKQIEMEVTLELWRAYHSSHQRLSARVHKEECIRFLKTLAERYPGETIALEVSGQDNEESIQMKLHFGILQNAIVSGRQLENALWHGKKCIAIAAQNNATLVEIKACLRLVVEVYNLLERYYDAFLYREKCMKMKRFTSGIEVEKHIYLRVREAYDTDEENYHLFNFVQTIIMESLLLQCKGFNRLHKYTDAIESGVKCMEIALEFGNTQVEIAAALELWHAFRLLHKDDTAGAFYKEKCIEFVTQCVTEIPKLEQYGCQLSEDDNATLVEMKVHFAIMANAVENSEGLEQAVWHGKKSIGIAQEIGDKSNEMNACLLLANAYIKLKKYEKAIYCCQRCIEINQSLDYSSAEKIEIAQRTFVEVCTSLYLTGSFDRAILQCERFLEDCVFCDAYSKHVVYSILQSSYASKEEYVLSIMYGSICKDICKDISIDKNEEAAINLELATAYYALNLTDEALFHAQKCADIAKLTVPANILAIKIMKEPRLDSSHLLFYLLAECCQLVNLNNNAFEIFMDLTIQSWYYPKLFIHNAKRMADIARTLDDEEIQNYAGYIEEKCHSLMLNEVGQYEKAILHNDKACEFAEQIEDQVFLTEAYLSKSRLHILINQITESELSLEIAEKAAENCPPEKRLKAMETILCMKKIIYTTQKCKNAMQLNLDNVKDFASLKECLSNVIDAYKQFLEMLITLQISPKQHDNIQTVLTTFKSKTFCPQYVKEKFSDFLSHHADTNQYIFNVRYCMLFIMESLMENIKSTRTDFDRVLIKCSKCETEAEAMELLRKSTDLFPKGVDESYEIHGILFRGFSPSFQAFKKRRRLKSEMSIKDAEILLERMPLFRLTVSELLIGQIYSYVGTLYYLNVDDELAEINFKKAITCFENVFESYYEDENLISIEEEYYQTFQLLLKVQVEMNRIDEALLTLDRCRSKALQHQLTKILKCADHNKVVTLREIASFVGTNNHAIILYAWFGNKLYIFCVRNTIGLGEENVIDVDCHVQIMNVEKREALQLHPTRQDEFPFRTNSERGQQKTVATTSYHAICCKASRNLVPADDDDEGHNSLLQKLHEELLSPVLGKITGDEIIIIPDGQLYTVPFAAFQDPTTKRFLSEDKRLRFSPSITSLIIHQRVPDDYYCHQGSLIIGNPSVKHIKGVTPLPGAEKEAEIIAHEIIGGVMPLIGSRATKPAVLERLSDNCLIHFACHMSFNPSAIILTAEEPLQNDKDSYRLKPEDIMKKEVHARLVVLSGCDSGRGKICAEGVIGIARAFLAAGAAAVLFSLWRVGDHSTCEFMTNFYTYLLDGDVRRTAGESLHLTIHEMRTKYPNEPKNWSGFHLMGDDVTIDRKSLSESLVSPPCP